MKVDLSTDVGNAHAMKAHIFISMGLLFAAIFFYRGLEALGEPGLGLQELYILGGFLIAGLLIHAGWKERKSS